MSTGMTRHDGDGHVARRADAAGLPTADASRAGWPAARVSRWIILLDRGDLLPRAAGRRVLVHAQDPHGGVSVSGLPRDLQGRAAAARAFAASLVYSLEIAVVTIVLSLALMLPTQLLLHLRLPRWRGLVEIITLLPLVFPPVVLVVGVSDVYSAGAAGRHLGRRHGVRHPALDPRGRPPAAAGAALRGAGAAVRLPLARRRHPLRRRPRPWSRRPATSAPAGRRCCCAC